MQKSLIITLLSIFMMAATHPMTANAQQRQQLAQDMKAQEQLAMNSIETCDKSQFQWAINAWQTSLHQSKKQADYLKQFPPTAPAGQQWERAAKEGQTRLHLAQQRFSQKCGSKPQAIAAHQTDYQPEHHPTGKQTDSDPSGFGMTQADVNRLNQLDLNPRGHYPQNETTSTPKASHADSSGFGMTQADVNRLDKLSAGLRGQNNQPQQSKDSQQDTNGFSEDTETIMNQHNKAATKQWINRSLSDGSKKSAPHLENDKSTEPDLSDEEIKTMNPYANEFDGRWHNPLYENTPLNQPRLSAEYRKINPDEIDFTANKKPSFTISGNIKSIDEINHPLTHQYKADYEAFDATTRQRFTQLFMAQLKTLTLGQKFDAKTFDTHNPISLFALLDEQEQSVYFSDFIKAWHQAKEQMVLSQNQDNSDGSPHDCPFPGEGCMPIKDDSSIHPNVDIIE